MAKMTEKQDAKYDKAHGIKEGSKRDLAQDKKMGVAQGGGGSKSPNKGKPAPMTPKGNSKGASGYGKSFGLGTGGGGKKR